MKDVVNVGYFARLGEEYHSCQCAAKVSGFDSRLALPHTYVACYSYILVN
jgi:hypothetical protein